jgi:integrase
MPNIDRRTLLYGFGVASVTPLFAWQTTPARRDPCMCGDYHMTMDPNEKDALGGEVEVLEKEQLLPLDSIVHADLIRRIRALGVGRKWVFQSRAGTPINSSNVRRRCLHPAAAAVGVKIGGWHDFRHTLTRMMRRAGVNAVVVSGTLGHK